MYLRHKTLGATLLDISPPDQHPPTTGLALKSTEGGTGATLVSDISSGAFLASEIIKANTIFCGATKLVVSLSTSTPVNDFAVDAIIKAKADKLYDTQANKLTSQIKVLYGGTEMNMNELVCTYMSEHERKWQVANGNTIDFTNSDPTALTNDELTFPNENITIAHPISCKVPPITALGSRGFFKNGNSRRILVFQF